LESLEGMPKKSPEFILLNNLPKLTSLEHIPAEAENYVFGLLKNLKSLKELPKEFKQFGLAKCGRTKFFKDGPEKVEAVNFEGDEYETFKYFPEINDFENSKFSDKINMSVLEKYQEIIKKLGYDKTQEYWPRMEKLLTFGDDF
jgi:hypothetical protein